jgi:5-methylcytosine-specific restriction endonuclease McrA
MHDPTNSRYRYINFRGSGAYRRFVKENETIENVGLPYQDNDVPAHGTYGALMFDPRWRARREEILVRDARHCVVCHATTNLQVHHRQYHFIVRQNQFKLPWDYPSHLLITLCESCHKRGHAKFKVPTINI